MEDIKTDICVIGAGSGGLSVAAGAVQMGARVVLIEGAEMGGDCLNTGCVPSKALIAAAKQAHLMRKGAALGIAPVTPEVDFSAVMAHVRSVIDGIAPHDSEERFAGLGVKVIRAFAAFTDPDTVEAGAYRVKARRFVIATGSSPVVPPIPGLDTVPFLTNETVFQQTHLPKHLLVIGGGPIGLELAQAHARLGAEVTVVEGANALSKEDPELAAIALENLRAEGITILEGTKVQSVNSDGGVTLTTEDGQRIAGSDLLLAVGRKPNIEALNLVAAGVDHTRTGITVDAGLKTSNRRIYAIGDVAGGMQFTHVAGYQAGVIIRSALFGLPAKARADHIPWATYIDPELAQVGLTEAAAKAAHGDQLEVLRFAYAENDRARAMGATTGLIKVMVVKGRPVGASVVGAQAGELIQLWAHVIANRQKIGAVANMVAPYPTLGELNKRAAGQYYVPRLFESTKVQSIVKWVQKYLP